MAHLKKKTGRKTDTGWHDRFVDALCKTRSVNQACAVAGVSRRTAYRHRDEFPEFSADWAEAKRANVEDLEASAMRRAIEGYKRPIFQGGAYVGEQIHYETSLTIFLLKCMNPERFNIDSSMDSSLSTDQTAAAVRAAIDAMRVSVPEPPDSEPATDD